MSETVATPTPTAPPPAARGPGTKQLVVVVLILAAGIGLTALTSDVDRVSEPGVRVLETGPFLPDKAGGWTGGEQTGLTEAERKVLPPDTEGVRRFYRHTDGTELYCSVVLAGRDVTSIHRPELCLTGQGWKLEGSRTETISTPAARGGNLEVTRMNSVGTFPARNGQTVTAYSVFVYWFVGKDRTTAHHWQRIYWTTLDRVFHNRNHRWAYFLINLVVPGEKIGNDPLAAQDEAMQSIARFVQDVYPQLSVH